MDTEINQSILGKKQAMPPRTKSWLHRLFAFIGPAYLVSVGYMDPGNWATDIEAGAKFGYALIWVLLLSNMMALLLQTLATRLGVVTGMDLARHCREDYPGWMNSTLWIFAEIAITATDLAETLGTVIGLKLLFGIPLLWGCLITAFDTFLFLLLERLGVRKIEAFIVALVATIGLCFVMEIFFANPDPAGILRGFVPTLDPSAIYICIGIIGATVMPHNLYLHSALVQTRSIASSVISRKDACKFNFIDSAIALNMAFLVNAAILIVAAAAFYAKGIEVTEIQQAHALLEGVLGTSFAPIVFAVALIAAGQSSTITGTLSGQVVMEGFINLRIAPAMRRFITRAIALVPAVIVIALMGDHGVYQLLIFSQVVLGFQLPFAIIPLVRFTSDNEKMGVFSNPRWLQLAAAAIALLIVGLNIKLISSMASELSEKINPLWMGLIYCGLAAVVILLLLVSFPHFFKIRLKRLLRSEADKVSEAVAAAIKVSTVKNIGVALEHSKGDSEIISAAITQALCSKAALTLIHIVDTPGVTVLESESSSMHGNEDEEYLKRLLSEVKAYDIETRIYLGYGRPAFEIIKAVKKLGIDFLVVGSHGHRGFEDLIFGQTINTVRHKLSIPVLVVRSGKNEESPAP